MAHKNREIEVAGHRYEIFWTSEYAKHVLDNFPDKDHRINHVEIGQLLGAQVYVEHQGNNRYLFLSYFRSTLYNTFAFLERGTSRRPGRCVVITSFKVGGRKYDLLAAAST